MRIAVLQPAISSEDPFAALTGNAEVASLAPEHTWLDVEIHKHTVGRQLIELARQNIDVVVNLCDGAWDADRAGVEVIHGLERVGLAYTGADARCYDPTRLTMKLACEAAGVGFPAFAHTADPAEAPAIAARLRAPWIVKHPQGYGSLGMTADSKVHDLAGLTREITRITAAYGSALVEEFIVGREFLVLVAEPLNAGELPRTWPAGEVRFEPGESFRHFDAKWTEGSWMEILADLPLAARLQDAVARAFAALGGVGYARCDLRMTQGGEIHLLEFNANCGLFMPPDQCAADEMMAAEPGGRRAFLDHILATALRRHADRIPSWTVHHERGRGFGLTAARTIQAGEVILADAANPHRLAMHTAARDPDPELWRPLDHACDPSASLQDNRLTARRTIPAGERITLDHNRIDHNRLDHNRIDHNRLPGPTPACTCTGPCVATRVSDHAAPAPGA